MRLFEEGVAHLRAAEALVKEVFLDSDTDAGVISGLFGPDDGNPTTVAYASHARELVERSRRATM